MKDTKSIKVLNYGGSKVALSGINREYTMEAASNGRPASLLLPLDDVDHINSNTDVFRNGLLTFEDSDYAEAHRILGNIDIAQTAYPDKRIRDMILKPNYEKMQQILAINSISLIERFRAELIRIKSVGTEGVSGNVERIINERYREINAGVRQSRITLRKESFSNDGVDKLQEKLDALERRVAAMQSPNAPTSPVEVDEKEVSTSSEEQATITQKPKAAQKKKATPKPKAK